MDAKVTQPLNAAQIELLNSVAHIESEEDLRELKHTLSTFFAKLADREIDRLWDEGVINEEVIEGWAHEHMRTPAPRCKRQMRHEQFQNDLQSNK